jgi:uncharacterized protein YcbK (DUF882 family)
MQIQRRELLRFGFAAATATGLGASASGALAALGGGRELTLRNLHTGESLTAAYWEAGRYLPDALAEVSKVLRDHRTGEVHAIDPRLLDLLASLAGKVEARPQFQVISGYRSPASNASLHSKSSGVATKSLHMQGKAIDIRMGGVDLAHVRRAALGLRGGGVGYYPSSDFVHVDTGRVRQW